MDEDIRPDTNEEPIVVPVFGVVVVVVEFKNMELCDVVLEEGGKLPTGSNMLHAE